MLLNRNCPPEADLPALTTMTTVWHAPRLNLEIPTLWTGRAATHPGVLVSHPATNHHSQN
ncbi:hypothetical protein M407DRAFT_243286 [Tulasnella calospora MUT 4182]|uniref:Uncharacterized protein n=1 Tax=Tulasnella calospora MUT 4182 TaxID=1051891 RepID=A0A0C3QLY1_9AGAM|nr:hypothetical protein M407DRAFT_243286 [Tulasnella calospora MUT 4182]